MEKFRFGRKLTEAVLSYENGQPYVTVAGEKRRVRSPVPLPRDGIGEEGIACLISEEDALRVSVLAVLYDDLQREKEWLCINPLLMEQAVCFFFETRQMEKMVTGYEIVSRQTFADFVIDDVCIIELKFPRVAVKKETGSYVVANALFQPAEHLRRCLEGIILHTEIRRVILLIPLPYKGDSLLKTAMQAEIRQILTDASTKGLTVEFWTAEMQFEVDGISLLSYENVTDMLTGAGTV